MKLNSDLFREIVEHTSDIVVITLAEPLDEPGPEIVFANQALFNLTGYAREEVIGKTPRIFRSEDCTVEQRQRIRAALESHQPIHETVLNRTKDGRRVWLDMKIVPLSGADGRVTHFASIERDITARKELEQHLKHEAMTDPLTELPNRRAFLDAAERELARALRYRHPLSLAMLDIDHFKQINDQYGHEVGDCVLQALAQMTDATLRTSDLVARLGGEEFAILMPETEVGMATHVMNRLRQRLLTQPVAVGSQTVRVSASIGVAAAGGADDTVEGLLRAADEAMYAAKKAGRNQVCAA